MKIDKVKHILFIIIGLLAFVCSFNPDINYKTLYASQFQLFGLTMLTIGGCGLYKAIKNGKG